MMPTKSISTTNNHVWRDIFRGYSLNRVLRDNLLRSEVALTGNVLDIGGGISPYYWKYFSGCEFVSADMRIATHEGVEVDLEKPLPFESGTFESVLCLSVLEHIWDYSQLVKESLRVKKSDAFVYFWIPFMMQPHGTYGDYFRYTDAALERIFLEAGYSFVEVTPLNNYFWVLGNLISQPIYEFPVLRPLTLVSNALFILLGKTLGRFVKGRWPIGYLVKAN